MFIFLASPWLDLDQPHNSIHWQLLMVGPAGKPQGDERIFLKPGRLLMEFRAKEVLEKQQSAESLITVDIVVRIV